MTRAWRRRGDASEIQAVAAGQINDPPSARAAAATMTTPKAPAVAYRANPIAEIRQPATMAVRRPQRSATTPPGTSSTPPNIPAAKSAVPALAADRFRCAVTSSGSSAVSPAKPSWNRTMIAAVTSSTRPTLGPVRACSTRTSASDHVARPWVSVYPRNTSASSKADIRGRAEAM